MKRPTFIIIIAIVLTPLILVKNIEKLRFVSVFAILSISSFSIMVIYNFFAMDTTPKGFAWWIPEDFDFKKALASLPTIILAYNW